MYLKAKWVGRKLSRPKGSANFDEQVEGIESNPQISTTQLVLDFEPGVYS